MIIISVSCCPHCPGLPLCSTTSMDVNVCDLEDLSLDDMSNPGSLGTPDDLEYDFDDADVFDIVDFEDTDLDKGGKGALFLYLFAILFFMQSSLSNIYDKCIIYHIIILLEDVDQSEGPISYRIQSGGKRSKMVPIFKLVRRVEFDHEQWRLCLQEDRLQITVKFQTLDSFMVLVMAYMY